MHLKMNSLIVAVLALFVFSSCSEDPTAEFTPSKDEVQVGEVITFEEESSGADKYYWDFGDGTQQQLDRGINPTHKYDEPGTYTVTLLVENEKGDATSTTSAEIVVAGGSQENQSQIMDKSWRVESVQLTFYISSSVDTQETLNVNNLRVDFINDNEYIRFRNGSNETKGNWELLTKDRVYWDAWPNFTLAPGFGTSSGIYRIDNLTSNSMKFLRVEKGINANGDSTRTEYTYTFSR